jgi:hypothetical protein
MDGLALSPRPLLPAAVKRRVPGSNYKPINDDCVKKKQEQVKPQVESVHAPKTQLVSVLYYSIVIRCHQEQYDDYQEADRGQVSGYRDFLFNKPSSFLAL